jgi:hypothetical protein
MTQPNILKLGRRGNPKAIATFATTVFDKGASYDDDEGTI